MLEASTVVAEVATETTSKVITIKKTELALFKGLGKDLAYVAQHFGITPIEAKNVMEQAGLLVTRKPKAVTPTYTIQYVDDFTFANV